MKIYILLFLFVSTIYSQYYYDKNGSRYTWHGNVSLQLMTDGYYPDKELKNKRLKEEIEERLEYYLVIQDKTGDNFLGDTDTLDIYILATEFTNEGLYIVLKTNNLILYKDTNDVNKYMSGGYDLYIDVKALQLLNNTYDHIFYNYNYYPIDFFHRGLGRSYFIKYIFPNGKEILFDYQNTNYDPYVWYPILKLTGIKYLVNYKEKAKKNYTRQFVDCDFTYIRNLAYYYAFSQKFFHYVEDILEIR